MKWPGPRAPAQDLTCSEGASLLTQASGTAEVDAELPRAGLAFQAAAAETLAARAAAGAIRGRSRALSSSRLDLRGSS